MNERGQRSRRSNKTVAYIAAGLIHAVIIGALFVNFTKDKPEVVDAAYAEKVDVVRATTVDQAELKKHQDLLKQQDRDKEREKELEEQRLKDLQAQAEKEKQRIEDLKKQQEEEKEKAEELLKEREALALKRKEEEEELAERKKKEAEEEERKKKLAEEQERKEQLAKELKEQQEAEMQKQLQEQLAAEEAFVAEQISKERTTTLVQKHLYEIGQKIKSVRTLSPGIETWRKSTVNIKVSPSGDVQSVRTIESSGNVQYDRSVETAVYKASPLPIPDANEETQVNKQFWDFDFIVKVSD